MNDTPDRDLDVLVLGDARPDLWLRGEHAGDVIFDDRGRVVEHASLELGGGGAVACVALARLGLHTAFVGAVGDDAFGRFVLEELEREGVEVGGMHVAPDRATGVSVVLTRGSDHAILAAPGAVAQLRGEHVDRRLVERARHVHVTSYFVQTGLQADVPSLFAAAKAGGATTSIDPNEDPTDRWEGGLFGALDRTDVLFPNSSEVRRITGIDDVDIGAESLAEHGTTIAVKFGQGGGMVVHAGGSLRVEAVSVDVVDRTGAGAAFDAGYLSGMLRGWSSERCLRLAVGCGGLAVRASGSTSALPTMDQALAAVGGA
ncbi:MAG: carbohydrate kinase family protein [Actinomycetota bacterium]